MCNLNCGCTIYHNLKCLKLWLYCILYWHPIPWVLSILNTMLFLLLIIMCLIFLPLLTSTSILYFHLITLTMAILNFITEQWFSSTYTTLLFLKQDVRGLSCSRKMWHLNNWISVRKYKQKCKACQWHIQIIILFYFNFNAEC